MDQFMEQLSGHVETAQTAFGEFAESLGAQGWIGIGIALVVIIVIVVIARAAGRSARMNDKLHEMEAAMADQLKRIEEQTRESAQKNRDEVQGSLKSIGDTLQKSMGEMTRTHQSQLDSFAGQLRDVNSRGEERLDGIKRTVEDRLVQYQDRMDRVSDVLDDKLTSGDRQLDKFREVIDARMESLQRDNSERLMHIERTVDDKLNTTLDRRLNESFRLVSDRLDRVYQGLGEMQSLASGVGDLKRVLSNVHAKGVVGEIQLGALLAQILTPEQYREHVRIKPGGEDVSYAIVLPGKTRADGESLMPIDASFPSDLYEQLITALDEGNKNLAHSIESQLATAVRDAARHVSEQFVSPPQTTDFAVLFLGSEGLYADMIRVPGLQQQIQLDYHVMLAGPTTLSALLNSLQMGMKTIAIERRSEEVWELLGAVRDEIATFAEALTRTQKRIRQASESIEDAAEKSRVIQRKLRDAKLDGPMPSKSTLQPGDMDDDW